MTAIMALGAGGLQPGSYAYEPGSNRPSMTDVVSGHDSHRLGSNEPVGANCSSHGTHLKVISRESSDSR